LLGMSLRIAKKKWKNILENTTHRRIIWWKYTKIGEQMKHWHDISYLGDPTIWVRLFLAIFVRGRRPICWKVEHG
jgi:hypothetical protein